MLDEHGVYDDYPPGRKRRRKRPQSRALPPREIWDSENNNYHSRRPRRGGPMRWLIQALACLGLGLAIPFAIKWTYDEIFYRPDQFQLRMVSIETNGLLTDARVMELSGVEPGSSLTRLNLRAIEARLAASPSVKSAEVTRRMPDNLVIKVKERVPVAWMSCPEYEIRPLRANGFLIDAESVMFACPVLSDRVKVLPAIEIPGLPKPVEGTAIQSAQLNIALKLIRASDVLFAGQGMAIIDVRALNHWGLLCRYEDDLLVTFDLTRIADGLMDLDAILQHTRQQDLPIATINLAAMKNIPITFHKKIDLEKWQNSSATVLKNDVKIRETQKQHIQSILRGG